MLRDTSTGQTKEVAPLWDRSPSSLMFAPDNRTLYVTAQDLGQVSIFQVNTQFGDVRSVYSDGTNSLIAVTNEQLIFDSKTLVEPGDLYSITTEGEGLKRLTEVNKDKLAEIKFGKFEQFSFKGWNNEDVYGYWIKPANFQEGKNTQLPISFTVGRKVHLVMPSVVVGMPNYGRVRVMALSWWISTALPVTAKPLRIQSAKIGVVSH